MKRLSLFLALFLLCFNMVSAVPPFQTAGITSIIEYDIEFPKFEYIEQDQDYYFYSAVYFNNGTHLLNVDPNIVNCTLTGHNRNGTISAFVQLDYNATLNLFTKIFPSQLFTGGKGYYRVACADENNVTGFISNPFVVTFTGFETRLDETIIQIVFLLFFVGLLFIVYNTTQKVDFEKWYNGILNKYEDKNFVKMALSGIGFNIMKNSFILYYLIGFPIMTSLTWLASMYNVVSLIDLMNVLTYIYAWGFLLVGVVFLSYVQEWVMDLVDKIKKMDWGFDD